MHPEAETRIRASDHIGYMSKGQLPRLEAAVRALHAMVCFLYSLLHCIVSLHLSNQSALGAQYVYLLLPLHLSLLLEKQCSSAVCLCRWATQ